MARKQPQIQRDVAVIGGGAWGTALAVALNRAGQNVTIWAREPYVVDAINSQHMNTTYLPGIALDPSIKATSDLASVMDRACIFLVTPSQFTRAVCQEMKQAGLPPKTPVVLCCKGVEEGTYKLMTEVVKEVLPHNKQAVLSGPTFANEVAQGLPTSITLAARGRSFRDTLRLLIEQDNLKIFTSKDLIGAEIGGAVKNVIAIACGIAEGSGLGQNAKAALIVSGVQEMRHICRAKGGRMATLMKLCGIGDLVLTASSQSSRNFSLGYALGQGKPLSEIMQERVSIAEGVESSKSIVGLAKKHRIQVPISEAVYRIVHGKEDIKATIEALIRKS